MAFKKIDISQINNFENLKYITSKKIGNSIYSKVVDDKTKEKFWIVDKNFTADLYIPSNESEGYRSTENVPLKKINLKIKDIYKKTKEYASMGIDLYGYTNQEHNFIQRYFSKNDETEHNMTETHNWYLDIEVILPPEENLHKEAWKPIIETSDQGAMGKIVSIQIYDAKLKKFLFFGLKDFDKEFKSEIGELKYIKCETEEQLLRKFLGTVAKIEPDVIIGFNSENYDFPYLTLRIARVLGGMTSEEIFIETFENGKNTYVINPDVAKNSEVKQLSTLGKVKVSDTFENGKRQVRVDWQGIFLEDFQKLFKKYYFTTLPKYSLEFIGQHILGEGKVQHSEFVNFEEFFRLNYDLFVEYGLRDVELLFLLEKKMNLVLLAQLISWVMGVNLDDVRGTLKQWNAYLFAEYKKENYILPLKRRYKKFNFIDIAIEKLSNPDEKILKNMTKEKIKERLNYFLKLKEEGITEQKFVGGFVRGTGKYWKWVFSLDFSSLYPSIIEFMGIGPENLIPYEKLHEDLLNIKIKYANFYSDLLDTKEMDILDHQFIDNVFENENAKKEIQEILQKYNVIMTPNGVFFKKSVSVMGKVITKIKQKRKYYKNLMLKIEKEIEDLKKQNKEIPEELKEKRNLYDVFQLAFKILINSLYGSLSLEGSNVAANKEYYSLSITSMGRVSNIYVTRQEIKKLYSIINEKHKETRNGKLNYLDEAAVNDTDSGYVSIQKLFEAKFGQDYENKIPKEKLVQATVKYVDNVALKVVDESLEDIKNTLNGNEEKILKEDVENIMDRLISVGPKIYMARTYWNEGNTLAKPKIKITGLSPAKSSTPAFFRDKLKYAFENILIDGNVEAIKDYANKIKEETEKQNPSAISFNQSVSSLDYEYDKTKNNWFGGFNKNGRRLTAPINSRAALIHNMFIDNYSLNFRKIEPGEKISFIYMKEPNILKQNVFAFQNEEIFNVEIPNMKRKRNLKKFIDYDIMFEKGFLNNIKQVTDPMGWDFENLSQEIDEDEW